MVPGNMGGGGQSGPMSGGMQGGGMQGGGMQAGGMQGGGMPDGGDGTGYGIQPNMLQVTDCILLIVMGFKFVGFSLAAYAADVLVFQRALV